MDGSVAAEDLGRYLQAKGRAPRIRERRMTQFWQLDDRPLESRKFLEESIEYLDGKVVRPDDFAGDRR